jgi:hypothetical protein
MVQVQELADGKVLAVKMSGKRAKADYAYRDFRLGAAASLRALGVSGGEIRVKSSRPDWNHVAVPWVSLDGFELATYTFIGGMTSLPGR